MPGTRVWITQCLCPKRHAIMAASGLARDQEEAERTVWAFLYAKVQGALAAKDINPWCALCRAPAETWRYETARSRFRTMEEAQPELERLQAEMLAVNALFGDKPEETLH